MKTLTLAAVTIALLAGPAHAQGTRLRGPDPPTVDTAKKKVDDKAYTDALSRIPDSKVPFDPWQGVREKSPPPPAKTRR